MDANFTEMLEEFMGSALVTWVHLFEGIVDGGGSFSHHYMEVNSNSHDALRLYLRLTNGIFLNEVMRIIDPNPKADHINQNVSDDTILRVQNFSILNRHVRSYYQENLQQLILMPLPNIAILGRDPLTEGAVEELRRLLLLLLGCAVQCERKETFIQQIQSLDIETQAALATCIQEVTQDPCAVLPLQFGELAGLDRAELQPLFCSMARQIQGLLAQRDTHLVRIAELCQECEVGPSLTLSPGRFGSAPAEGLAVQLADSKAKLRRLKQELEDKSDQLLDYKQEIQTMEEEFKKLQQENRALQREARANRVLRDELDCLRERAAKAEQLQAEVKSCSHRLRSLDLYRTQLKEQQQYCGTLQENKALLEEQLEDARARCSALRELERDNLFLRQKLMDMEGERDTERQRVDELLEYNMSLQVKVEHKMGADRNTIHHTTPDFLQSEPDSDDELSLESNLKPLSVEVNEASSLRLLGAENENAELRRRLEHLQAEQEDNSLEVREELQRQTDKLMCLEVEHQNTQHEFQNLLTENTKLKKCLEELRKQQKFKNVEKELSSKERADQKRVIQRGEGEGKDTRKEERLVREAEVKEKHIIKAQREDGEGEEVLLRGQTEEAMTERRIKVKTKERGEAEGEKEVARERPGADENSVTYESDAVPEKLTKEETGESEGVKQMEESLLVPLAAQLQEAREEADRQAALAQDLRSSLGEQKRKAWEAEQKLVLLDSECQRLRKAAESLGEARKKIEVLQCETMQQEEELTRLRSQAQLQKMEAALIGQLEGERAALETERETLRASVDTLRAAVRKGDQLELTNQTLKAELERMGRSLESARRREEELEADLKESALEAESMLQRRDEALLEVNRLEQEKEACRTELDGQGREQRQREREMGRLRQQLESTSSALEHSHQRAYGLEAEHRRSCHELSQLQERCSQQEVQLKENQRLHLLYTESQAHISSLTQELADEKLQTQELSNQVGRLNQALAKLETKLRRASSSSQEPTEAPKRDVKETSTSPRPMEPSHPGGAARPQEGGSQETADTSIGGQDEMRMSGPSASPAPPTWLSSPRHGNHLACSPAKPNETLIETERENAVLQRERETLLSQLSQSQAAGALLKDQLEALQGHAITLQENCTKIQGLNTKLQVEMASLSSHHASAWTRCSESEARCAALEAESKIWLKEREESAARMESLRRDHERLTGLQQRQEVELEELLAKHSQLKSSSRTLEAQHRELEARYQELLGRQTRLEEGEKAVLAERGNMERDLQEQAERARELERLRRDNDRFHALQREWVQVQSELLAQGSVLRGELSTAQLKQTQLEGELCTLREQNQHLDLNNVRLGSQYQLLTQLKGNMEEESRHLIEQNQALARENRALLERSLESRDQHHNQQREYLDKLNEVRREKQKLLEKLMDQYRVLDPGLPIANKAKKTNWIADRMKKLIKPRGVREGRAQFIAAGSVENLAETGDSTPASPSPLLGPDPRSAPVSPTPLRRASSQPDAEDTPKALARSSRRKLGSRHGWGLGLGRGAGLSQSFSPGDQRIQPRERFRSANRGSSALWEAESSPTPSQESLNEEGAGESEEILDNLASERHSNLSRASSGPAEDYHSRSDKPLD